MSKPSAGAMQIGVEWQGRETPGASVLARDIDDAVRPLVEALEACIEDFRYLDEEDWEIYDGVIKAQGALKAWRGDA